MFCNRARDHNTQWVPYIEAFSGNQRSHQDLAALVRAADKAWAGSVAGLPLSFKGNAATKCHCVAVHTGTSSRQAT